MATRAMIGKVDRQGNGQAIYLGHDGCPDQAGDALLQHYSEEERIDRLIGRGYVTWLKPIPEASVTYHGDYGYSWEICQPRTFRGGTEEFFARYWDVGPEWLYAWTPDGWLASAAMPGAPPESYHADSEALRDDDPEWREWLRLTREFQRPQPLHSLVRDYRAQHLGSGEGSS